MKHSLASSLLVAVLLAASGAAATSVIDQVSPFVDTTFEAGTSALWQQEVVVGLEGFLTGVDLFWTPSTKPVIGANNVIDFSINVGPAWQSDANDFDSLVTFTAANDWNFIDVSSAGLYFIPGETFVIGVQNTFDNTTIGGSVFDQYPVGDLFLDAQIFTNSLQFDLAFRTHVMPIPEPNSAVLFGLGLLVVAGTLRRPLA